MSEKTQRPTSIARPHPNPARRRDETSEPLPDADLHVVSQDVPGLFGRNRRVLATPFVVGRAPECEFELPTGSVSRRHFSIERGEEGYVLRDLDSTNGTYVNDERVKLRPLRNGDEIAVGDVRLRFRTQMKKPSSQALQATRPCTVDRVSGLPDHRDLMWCLSQAAASGGSTLGAIAVRLLNLAEVNQEHGTNAGDELLRVAAETLTRGLPAQCVAGRLSGDTFLVIASADPTRLASRILERMDAARMVRHGQEIRPRAVAGVGEFRSFKTSADLVAAVLHAAWRARTRGSGAIVSTEAAEDTGFYQDPKSLDDLRAFIREKPECGLLAVALENEAAVLHELGVAAKTEWREELISDVGAAIGGAAPRLFDVWERYLVIAFPAASANSMEKVARTIRDRFTSRPMPADYGGPLRKGLRQAMMTAADVQTTGGQPIDKLLGRLEVGDERLPTPLVAFRPRLALQNDEAAKLKTLIDWFERSVIFLCAIAFSAVRETRDPKNRDKVIEVTRRAGLGQPLTLGTWVSWLWDLAQLLPSESADPVSGAMKRILNGRGDPAPLVRELQAAVQDRNLVTHGVGKISGGYTDSIHRLHRVLERLVNEFRALDLDLVSLAPQGAKFIPPKSMSWRLYRHHGVIGPSTIERATDMTIAFQDRWCYALAGSRALLLAPLIGAVPCQNCNQLELVVPDRLLFADGNVKCRGLLTDHEHTLLQPDYISDEAKSVHAALSPR